MKYLICEKARIVLILHDDGTESGFARIFRSDGLLARMDWFYPQNVNEEIHALYRIARDELIDRGLIKEE